MDGHNDDQETTKDFYTGPLEPYGYKKKRKLTKVQNDGRDGGQK
jgi:hypothetical protein